MKINNKYGYKVMYEENKKKKQYLVTNSLELALWEIENYLKLAPYKKITLPLNPVWHLDAVKTLKEYNKLWKGCPFKDDLFEFKRRNK